MRLPPDVQDFLVAKGYVDGGEWTEKALAGGPADPGAIPVHLELDGETVASSVRAAAEGVSTSTSLVTLETREPVEGTMAEETKPKTPDITPAQMVALVGSAIALGAAFGFDLGAEREDAIIGFVTIAAPFLLGADAVIRAARSAFVFRKK